jgi:hypothetical protein
MKPVSTLTPITLKTLVAGVGVQSLKKVFEATTSRNFYGMILLIENSMSQLIKRFFVSAKENGGFQLIPAIVVFLLALSFQGAIVYIMISSLR